MPKPKKKRRKIDYTNAHEMHDVIEDVRLELWEAEKRFNPKAIKPMGVHVEVYTDSYAIVIRSFGLAFPNHRRCARVVLGWMAEGSGYAEKVEDLERVAKQVITTMVVAREHHDEIQAKKAAKAARKQS